MNAVARPLLYRHFHRIAWLAVALALGVIVFGAFVRLSNAGLSCPDWPTCYGRATWPKATHEVVDHAASAIRPFETHKAWREQIHRHLAATLGTLVLILSLLAARRRRFGLATILGASALVAAAIPLYMHGEHVAASVLAIIGEAILLVAAFRWSNIDLARATALTLAVIIFQALLGMWTVTWLLKPIVVMGHLVGGLTTFSLLVWIAWRATDRPITLAGARVLRNWVIVGLVLLGIQIALGGWVSANYAAVACGLDFPKCVGRWWPPTNFSEGFVLWRGIGVDYEGGVLDGASRIAIQMTHRIMAVIVALYMLLLSWRLLRTPGMRGWAVTVLVLILAQFTLGVLNVKLNLPLHVAVAHNAGAALLLFTLVSLCARLRSPE
ncbi:COX15/CtaA family protein [Pseudoxanthomonas indica]|uniref:Cytochrome c oxidase assembly protein subunit 15 n=1 Tax=Pseudoxanthomonas indica TaxID=428993 RepID=A0A1T5KUB2_9GAMM|nr:COX15/CtaA family protein [Pseudoxanthomonas indica]GGD51814.1 cytochrome oxidase assembly protein [Pseudoxanthomonas indica]SKC67376.1 cytochrome c oxidase assembly protein subunit 15 [Pseudoxanthomonas indica]